MQNLEYNENLIAAGLTKEEAAVYELLLKLGELPVSSLAKQIPNTIPLSRSATYKVLEILTTKELVGKNDTPGKVATFYAKHPVSIVKALDSRKVEIEKAKEQFIATSGRLTSLFNLHSGRPGIQYFEGKDGVWEVLMDSLTASEEILTYADLEAINKYIPDLNAEYSTLREEKEVKKRGLVIDSPEARRFLKSYTKNTTTTKLIASDGDSIAFNTVVQIYDNKISYITMTDNYLVGMIVSDQHIANTHRYLFESLWKLSSGEVV